ncbi:MAG: HAMP domain-containing protein, partial [Caldilineae bacterium]
GNTLRTHIALDDLAQEQFERRSVATATGLAAQITEPMLTNDLFALYDMINKALLNTPDMRYVLVLDAEGRVLAHTFGPGLPRGLVEANDLGPDKSIGIRRLRTEEGPVLDVAAPLPEGVDGVLRLGMSERDLIAAVDRHTMQLLALTALSLLPVLTFTYILGRALTRPLLQLVDVTRAIARGDLGQTAPSEGRDEVAQLGASFNAMTEALAASQAALQASNRTLQERNEELATLYAIATAIAFADSVENLAEAALARVLDVLGLQAGWVLLAREEDNLYLAAYKGLAEEMVAQWRRQLPQECVPADLQTLSEAIIAHEGRPCPNLGACFADEARFCHTAVPLRSRRRVWGVMHVACPYPGCVSTHRLGLLTTIGNQVGVAIENTHLATEQQHQLMRRRLLEQVMAAQEEERKRIARELHDELAQSLIVLMRDLEHLAEQVTPGHARLRRRIRDTRSLVQRTLDQTRSLIFDLRPTILDDLGLVPALRRYARQRLEEAGIQFRLDIEGETSRLPAAIETALYRIAQEAISNVMRHARASRVDIALRFAPEQVEMCVQDDGVGFDVPSVLAATSRNGCIGLLGMRERAELLGGQLHLDSRPQAGTTLTVRIPLEDSAHDTRDAGG